MQSEKCKRKIIITHHHTGMRWDSTKYQETREVNYTPSSKNLIKLAVSLVRACLLQPRNCVVLDKRRLIDQSKMVLDTRCLKEMFFANIPQTGRARETASLSVSRGQDPVLWRLPCSCWLLLQDGSTRAGWDSGHGPLASGLTNYSWSRPYSVFWWLLLEIECCLAKWTRIAMGRSTRY